MSPTSHRTVRASPKGEERRERLGGESLARSANSFAGGAASAAFGRRAAALLRLLASAGSVGPMAQRFDNAFHTPLLPTMFMDPVGIIPTIGIKPFGLNHCLSLAK